MAGNVDLTAARIGRSDEFYTQMADIEKELTLYEAQFLDRTVLCNCDDPAQSQFWAFFARNLESWGLRRLLAVQYCPGGHGRAWRLDRGWRAPVEQELEGDGDFRSPESLQILDSADIVVTNPPFSLFRPYTAQLVEHGKRFLILGHLNAITYRDFFPLIMSGQVWMGHSIHSGDREFRVPDTYPLRAAGWRIDGDGTKYIRVKGVRWWTNLDHPMRHTPLDLSGRHFCGCEADYPRYDDGTALDCSKVSDIPGDFVPCVIAPAELLARAEAGRFQTPSLGWQRLRAGERVLGPGDGRDAILDPGEDMPGQCVLLTRDGDLDRLADCLAADYGLDRAKLEVRDGVMGVPITFLDKHCPDQFEILGIANSSRWIGYPCSTWLGGRKVYNRLLVRRSL